MERLGVRRLDPDDPVKYDFSLCHLGMMDACGFSRAQWFKLFASGRTPLPVRLGTRRPVYLIAELEAWLKAGAPDRATWLHMKDTCRVSK